MDKIDLSTLTAPFNMGERPVLNKDDPYIKYLDMIKKGTKPNSGRAIVKITYNVINRENTDGCKETYYDVYDMFDVEIYPRTYNHYNEASVDSLHDDYSEIIHAIVNLDNENWRKRWQDGQSKTYKLKWDVEWLFYECEYGTEYDTIPSFNEIIRIK